jgi:hypothetical protein
MICSLRPPALGTVSLATTAPQEPSFLSSVRLAIIAPMEWRKFNVPQARMVPRKG